MPSRKIPSAKVCGTLGINHLKGREMGGACASKIWCSLVAASGGMALGVAVYGGALLARCGVLSIGAECSRDERLDRPEELGECMAYGRREVQLEVVPG